MTIKDQDIKKTHMKITFCMQGFNKHFEDQVSAMPVGVYGLFVSILLDPPCLESSHLLLSYQTMQSGHPVISVFPALSVSCHLSFQSWPVFRDFIVCWCVQETFVFFLMYGPCWRYYFACCNTSSVVFLAVRGTLSALLKNHISAAFIFLFGSNSLLTVPSFTCTK